MKNILTIAFALFLGTTLVTQAAPFSWDYSGGIIRLLAPQNSAEVRIPYLTATSSATNTLPVLAVPTRLSFGGVIGTAWSDFCVAITGGSGLCDGTDATGGGGGSNWLDNGTYLTPLTSTDGLIITGSSTFADLQIQNSTTTGTLSINANRFKQHAAGFLDLQRTGADFTLMRIRAPRGDSNEATLSLVNDLSTTDAGVDEEFVDIYNERYADSLQWGMRQAYSGAGIPKPFVIGHWNTAGGKDIGNKFIILPSGSVAVAMATATVPKTTAFYVASSTATNIVQVDSAPGTTRFAIANNGTMTAGTSTLATTTISRLTIGSLNGLLNSSSGLVSTIATSTLNIDLANTVGTLAANRGGTSLSTIAQNQLLIGGAGNTWTQVATTSLGLATPFSTSAQLAALLNDETGTSSLVFASSPTFGGTLSSNIANTNRLGVNTSNGGSAAIEVKSLTSGSLQGLRIEADSLANTQFSTFLTGDSFTRFSFLTDGVMKWGPGYVVADTQLYRNGTSSLLTPGAFVVGATSTLGTTSLTRALLDVGGSSGTNGMVLLSTGTSTRWAATSTLGIAGGGGGFTDPLTTDGDIIARVSGATTRLAQGANGTYLGVSGGVLGYYTPSGSGTINSGNTGQVPYYTATGTAISGTSTIYIAADGKVGIGTTTPGDKLTVGVGNNQGIEVLSTNSAFIGYGKSGADRWRMQNEFTNVGLFEILYNNGAGGPAGTSLMTLTGTGSGIAGRMGIGTTSPPATITVQGLTVGQMLARFANSVGATMIDITSATSSVTHNSTLSGFAQEVLSRVTIGINSVVGYYRSGKLFGALTISGLFYQQDWNQVDCSQLVGATQIIADGLTGCDGFAFYEDGTETMTSGTQGGLVYARLSTSLTAGGAGVFVNAPSTGAFIFGTSTPKLEVTARMHTMQNWATSTRAYIGFTNIAAAGNTYEIEPTVGCYFTASSSASNWLAVCRTSAAAQTVVDTGVASTTAAGTGDGRPYRFFIEADSLEARFYIQSTEAGNLTQVAGITTNVPTTVALNAGAHFGSPTGIVARGIDIYDMNFGWRKALR